MPVFFVSPQDVTPPTISARGELLVHLRDSLRIHVGELVWFADGTGHRYRTSITDFTKQSVTGTIVEVITQPPANVPAVILGQALLKGEKMDWVIQKATELGVHEIKPVESRHSIVQLRADRVDHQLGRWQRIALEASQQSEQWRVPSIAPPQSLNALLTHRVAGTETLLLAERRGGKSLQTVGLPQDVTGSVLLLLGPEGGWSNEEITLAKEAGCRLITLGQHILRSETAALAAVSILQSRLGKLG